MSDQLGYTPENARSAEQAEEMIEAAKEKRCVFCDIDFAKNKPLNRLGQFDPEGKDWPLIWVWKNPYPQEHHKHHIMFIPKRHINNEEFFILTPDEWFQILDAWNWAVKFFDIEGGGFVGRFGKRSHNAGTIGHLHFQLQVPDLSGNVKATFFKDTSPIEQARRANRAAYSSKKLKHIDGYLITNNRGEYLSENFRWSEQRYIHTPMALGHIYLALKGWDEEIFEIIPAIINTTLLSISVIGNSRKPWELFAKKAVEISTAAIAKYGPRAEVLLYQNSAGRFLDDHFNWSNEPYYFHWHAERYIEEALILSNDEVPVPQTFYLNPGGEPSPTKCDSLNWIDDSEEFDLR